MIAKNIIISSINLEELKAQKEMLINLPSSNEVEGLLNLIDNIQDYCVDVLGIPENVVFDLSDED